MNTVRKKRKPKRHLRKSVVFGFAAIVIALVLVLWLPGKITKDKLKELGYNNTEIQHIQAADLERAIIDGQYYSDYLAEELVKDEVNSDYLDLYAAVDSSRGLSDVDFLLYNRLEDKGYEYDQLEALFSQLTTTELTPLLIYDYQWDESAYIEDVIASRGTENFVTGSYYTPYKLELASDTTDPITVLVNETYGLDASYVPSDLTDVSLEYALENVQLKDEAASAFAEFSQASESHGAKFYATEGYESYEILDSVWQSLEGQYGDYASGFGMKAGHNELQTGLTVNLASTYDPDSAFTDTESYKWAKENCYEYGFIQRYPAGKTYVTDFDEDPTLFRYVGKDVALALQASGLSYDEFYCLYLKSWDDPSWQPSKTVLENADWKKLVEKSDSDQ